MHAVNTILPIYERSAYGVTRVYPADAAQASALSSLTNARTLTVSQLEALRALGFTLRVVPDPRSMLATATL